MHKAITAPNFPTHTHTHILYYKGKRTYLDCNHLSPAPTHALTKKLKAFICNIVFDTEFVFELFSLFFFVSFLFSYPAKVGILSLWRVRLQLCICVYKQDKCFKWLRNRIFICVRTHTPMPALTYIRAFVQFPLTLYF